MVLARNTQSLVFVFALFVGVVSTWLYPHVSCGQDARRQVTKSSASEGSGQESIIPENALEKRIVGVFWVDVVSATPDRIQQTKEAMLTVFPEDDREKGKEVIEEMLRFAQVDQWKKLRDAGVLQIVMGVTAETLQGEKVANKQGGQLLLKLEPDSDPAVLPKLYAEFEREFSKAMNESTNSSPQSLGDLKFRAIGQQWYLAEGEHILPNAEKADSTQVMMFNEALSLLDGAAFRFCWCMDKATIRLIDKNRLSPSALFIQGLLQPLRELETATVGVCWGNEPKLEISMNFDEKRSAREFKSNFDQLLVMLGTFSTMSAKDPQTSAQARNGLSLLFLDQQNNRLSKTLEVEDLKQLLAAGFFSFEDSDNEPSPLKELGVIGKWEVVSVYRNGQFVLPSNQFVTFQEDALFLPERLGALQYTNLQQDDGISFEIEPGDSLVGQKLHAHMKTGEGTAILRIKSSASEFDTVQEHEEVYTLRRISDK